MGLGGRLSADQFELRDRLGTGSFGAVFRAVHIPSGHVCAIKRIDMESSDDDIEEIQREIAILGECDNDHITRYFGCAVEEFELWIVMEYLGGGSCADILRELGALPEPAIAQVLSEVLDGLSYLHARGKIHRDIKAANILLGSDDAAGVAKIADFGVAAQLSNQLSRRNTFVGTPFWMAPEVIDQQPHTFPADVWSLGITAIELATGQPPLATVPPMRALFNIPRLQPPRLDPARFSTDFQDFVAQCLQKKPDNRASVAQLRRHPFLQRASASDLAKIVRQHLAISPSPPPQLGRKESSATLADGQASGTAGEENRSDDFEQDDDDWDFDTIRATPSLEEILSHPPPGTAPLSAPSSGPQASPIHDMDTLTLKSGSTIQRRSGLVRVLEHAARKFRDPLLREISDMLATDPLTVGVERYIVKKLGKLALERHELQIPRDHAALDAVEEVLFERWLEERHQT